MIKQMITISLLAILGTNAMDSAQDHRTGILQKPIAFFI